MTTGTPAAVRVRPQATPALEVPEAPDEHPATSPAQAATLPKTPRNPRIPRIRRPPAHPTRLPYAQPVDPRRPAERPAGTAPSAEPCRPAGACPAVQGLRDPAPRALH